MTVKILPANLFLENGGYFPINDLVSTVLKHGNSKSDMENFLNGLSIQRAELFVKLGNLRNAKRLVQSTLDKNDGSDVLDGILHKIQQVKDEITAVNVIMTLFQPFGKPFYTMTLSSKIQNRVLRVVDGILTKYTMCLYRVAATNAASAGIADNQTKRPKELSDAIKLLKQAIDILTKIQ